jgi:hypothetical protein
MINIFLTVVISIVSFGAGVETESELRCESVRGLEVSIEEIKYINETCDRPLTLRSGQKR